MEEKELFCNPNEFVSKNDVLNTLHRIGGCDAGSDTWADGWDKAINNAFAAVQAMTADMTWISAKDSVPELYKGVLIHHKGGVTIGYYTGTIWVSLRGKAHKISTVTHWMAIPKPQKEENHES